MNQDPMISRRNLLAGGVGLLAAPALIVPGRALAAESIVYVSYGGATQEAEDRAMIKPFEAVTGIKVIDASGPDLAKLKAQVMGGTAEWDAIDFIGSQAVSAERQGLLEPLDYSVIDDTDTFIPRRAASMPWYVYGGGIGYDPKRTANIPWTGPNSGM